MQLIIAGKAHPADEPGQALIGSGCSSSAAPMRATTSFFWRTTTWQLAEQLVHGVDVWINTPRRPWEACGTSGMKVLVNGGINLSQLDGWWAEAYQPEVGWAIGDAQTHGDEGVWDDRDAAALFEVLEREVVPQFYTRDAAGIPTAWMARMRESMATLTPQFSSSRAVRDYTERYYLPAAQRVAAAQRRQTRQRRGRQAGAELARSDWMLPGASCASRTDVSPPTAAGLSSRRRVQLAGLAPTDVAVQLYANGSRRRRSAGV